jgi:hypothetical protein
MKKNTDTVKKAKAPKAKKVAKAKETKVIRVKNADNDLIETYDVDDFDLDLSYYRDIAGSMKDW